MDDQKTESVERSITVHCPSCGSREIREANTAYCEAEILGWEYDEETGYLMPTAHDLDLCAEWQTAEDSPYICRAAGCGWRGELDQLRVEVQNV